MPKDEARRDAPREVAIEARLREEIARREAAELRALEALGEMDLLTRRIGHDLRAPLRALKIIPQWAADVSVALDRDRGGGRGGDRRRRRHTRVSGRRVFLVSAHGDIVGMGHELALCARGRVARAASVRGRLAARAR